jgi:hypothetical protein
MESILLFEILEMLIIDCVWIIGLQWDTHGPDMCNFQTDVKTMWLFIDSDDKDRNLKVMGNDVWFLFSKKPR